MERWKVASRRKHGPLILRNRCKTLVWVNPNVSHGFDLDLFLKRLEQVRFPLRYTKGLSQINFTILGKKYFGLYEDGEIWIDTKKKRRAKTIIETFVHEVAHHLDFDEDLSNGLSHERKRRGMHVHSIARDSDEEYFARGFERYYSTDPRDKADLRKLNPRLYKRIDRLHQKYKRRPRVSS
jgi:hypothetical protein